MPAIGLTPMPLVPRIRLTTSNSPFTVWSGPFCKMRTTGKAAPKRSTSPKSRTFSVPASSALIAIDDNGRCLDPNPDVERQFDDAARKLLELTQDLDEAGGIKVPTHHHRPR